MKEGTWFVDRWYKTCMKCDLSVGEEDASYCPNCGKWLGSIRQHVVAFFMAAAAAFIVAIGMAAIAHINEGSLVYTILATVFGALCLGILYAIKPFGSYLVRLEGKKRRAEEWNAEVARRKREAEEDRAERERSANAKTKSGIVLNVEMTGARETAQHLLEKTDDLRKGFSQVQERLEKLAAMKALGLKDKQPDEIPLLFNHRLDTQPLGYFRVGDLAKLKEYLMCGMGLGLGFKERKGDDYDGRIQEISLVPERSNEEEFPLYDSCDYNNRQIGSVLVKEPARLRNCINDVARLRYRTCLDGALGDFFLEPIPKPVAEEFDKNKLDAAFNIRSVLPVRNAPPLQIAFIDGWKNRLILEDIKRNLEDVYRLKSSGLWEAVRQIEKNDVGRMSLFNLPVFTNRINMPALPGQTIAAIRVVDDGSGNTQFPQFAFEVDVKKKVDPTDPTGVGFEPTKCHKVFLSESCGVVITPKSPMGPNSCDKTRKDCMRWKNEERFSL